MKALTENRREKIATDLGYRDIHRTSYHDDWDGRYHAKSGYLNYGPSSGIWGYLPDDAELLKEHREWKKSRPSLLNRIARRLRK